MKREKKQKIEETKQRKKNEAKNLIKRPPHIKDIVINHRRKRKELVYLIKEEGAPDITAKWIMESDSKYKKEIENYIIRETSDIPIISSSMVARDFKRFQEISRTNDIKGTSAVIKSIDIKPADIKSVAFKTVGAKSTFFKSVDGKSADIKSIDIKPADIKSAAFKSVDGKSADI